MNFQTMSNTQGKQFDQMCRMLLDDAGWIVGDRPVVVREAGVEIDCEALHPDFGRVWFEFKGSWRGPRPGMMRTDTVKKAIVSGYLLRSALIDVPYVVMTSHLPPVGSQGEVMMGRALGDGVVAGVVCINSPTWLRDLILAVGR